MNVLELLKSFCRCTRPEVQTEKDEDPKLLSPAQEKVADRVRKFFPYEVILKGFEADLPDNTVVLSTGLKSGTTWSMQILHSMRSRGDFNFEDIHKVIPLVELIYAGNPEAVLKPQLWQPNVFNTKALYEECPEASKKIIVTRDCHDAALSLYHFMRNWFFTDEEMDLLEFIDLAISKEIPKEKFVLNALQMQHIASWYPHRKDEDVLWLHYEDMKENLPMCIRLIADFLGFDTKDEELMKIVEKQASFEFMKAHADRYDAHGFKFARNEAAGLPRDAGTGDKACSKVRNGKIGESQEVFTPDMFNIVNKKWNKIVKPVTGFETYKEMRESINKELGRSFAESN